MRAVGSGEHVPQLGSRRNGPVPHDIESPLADIDGAVRAGHRIADQFLAFRKAEVQGREAALDELRRGMALLKHASPGEIADVFRLHFRKQRPSNHGPHSVRANEQVAFEGRAVIKDGDSAIAVLHDLLYIAARMKVLHRKGIAQHVVK